RRRVQPVAGAAGALSLLRPGPHAVARPARHGAGAGDARRGAGGGRSGTGPAAVRAGAGCGSGHRGDGGRAMTARSAAEAEDRDLARAAPVLAAVREGEPLVHCLTATVSMAIVADGLLAARARPVMTGTRAEAPGLTAR